MSLKKEEKSRFLTGEEEQKKASPIKQKINNFLINYFNHLIFVLAFIVFAAGLFLFVWPQYQEIAKSNLAARKNLKMEYDANLKYLNKITALKESYQQIAAAERKKIEAMVPFNSQLTDLFPEIESIVVRNGALLNSIKIESVENQSQPETVFETEVIQEPVEGYFSEPMPAGVKLVKMEVNLGPANYQLLKNIIKTCENNLRLLDIAKISYAADEGSATMTIYTYYLE